MTTTVKLKFYTVPWRSRNQWITNLPEDIEYPCIVLVTDSWNDYGYKTYFGVNYFEQPGEPSFSRSVKILQKGVQTTEIPQTFEHLNSNYCSLGQSIEYYEELLQHGRNVYSQVFKSLNDIVFTPELTKQFESEHGFSKSLLRFSEAEKVYREAGSLFQRETKSKNLAFQFSCRVPGAQTDHVIDFNFSPNKTELHRITALIGRNGTGKTQVLANFANAMSGRKLDKDAFRPTRPSFSRVIAIAYSVFDEFDKPLEGVDTFSYKYCGIKTPNELAISSGALEEFRSLLIEAIKDENQAKVAEKLFANLQESQRIKERLLNQNEIKRKFEIALNKVSEKSLEQKLTRILETLLGAIINLSDIWIPEHEINPNFYDSLSSGQRILVLIMTEVIAYIARESIILFDEPEIHLHPDALSALARAFHLLLEEFDSYAIIATHSPILLQEIPSKYVRLFDRQGSYPVVTSLSIECFGENLTVITDDVFHTSELRNNYRDHLEKLAQSYSYNEIIEIFGCQLSFNARAFLSSLYKN